MTSKRKSESGQVVVLAAGAILVLVGMAALAVDVGFLYATRRNMQTAADAAAVAGANAMNYSCGNAADCTCSNVASCASSAADVATLNGFTNGGPNSTTVTVGAPATPPPNPVSGHFVQATVSEAVPTFFMRALGFSAVSVSTTAIAGYAPSNPCIDSLCAGSKTLVVSGGSDITANCPVYDESSDPDGMDVSGGKSVLDVSSISLVAKTWSGGSGGATVEPTPITGVAYTGDPLATATEPTPGACGAGTTSGGSGFKQASSPMTISEGTYCGGINVPAGDTLNLNPGTYILLGGGLTVSGHATLNGDGVTFYNTFDRSDAYKAVVFSGGSMGTLSAPGSGAASGIPGILFFQDRAAGGLSYQNTFSGGSSLTLSGALYFPTQQLVISGGSSVTPQNISLIACEVTFSGGSFDITGSGGAGSETPVTTTKLYQ